MFDLDAFRSAVDRLHELLEKTEETSVGIQLSADAWSLKEIVGHLIDSASNNHQRFVRLQIENLEGFPAYEAEQWIRIQQYNRMDWDLLKSLCMHYNLMILGIVERIPEKCLSNSWSGDDEQRTLQWLVNDYYRHLRWHTDHYQRRASELGHS
jgi:hypothetical protein